MSEKRLRDAANVLRERAEAATPGPWEWWETQQTAEPHVSEEGRAFFGLVATPSNGREDYGRGDAEFIATMHPGVALALADWLDDTATEVASGATYSQDALRVADQILGTDS